MLLYLKVLLRPFSTRSWLFWLLFGAFIVRLIYVLRFPDVIDLSIYGDQGTYDGLAKSLLQHGVFGWEGVSSAARAPLYPGFLALCYAVFGIHPLTARIIQALLGTLTVLGIYKLAAHLFDRKAALWAAAISAFYPFYIFYTGYLLQETMTIFLSVWTLVFISRVIEKLAGLRQSVLAGVVTGLLVLTKPTFLPFFFLALLVSWWLIKSQKQRVWRPVILMFIGFFLVVFPWTLRNRLRVGAWTIDTHGGMTSYEGIVHYADNKAGRGGEAIMASPFWAEIKDLSEIEQDKRFKAEVLKFIRTHPKTYISQVLKNFIDFWRLYPRTEKQYPHRASALVIVSLLTELPLFILTGWTLWLYRPKPRPLFPLLLFVFSLMCVHVLILAQMRYRLPVMSVFIVLASFSLAKLTEKIDVHRFVSLRSR